jgi:hypothetical protein
MTLAEHGDGRAPTPRATRVDGGPVAGGPLAAAAARATPREAH